MSESKFRTSTTGNKNKIPSYNHQNYDKFRMYIYICPQWSIIHFSQAHPETASQKYWMYIYVLGHLSICIVKYHGG